MQEKTVQVDTSWGCIKVVISEDGIAECTLPFLEKMPDTPFKIPTRQRNDAARFVIGALTGRAVDSPPPLQFPAGTDFQRRVWRAITRIPTGKTITYTELAKAVGQPRAVRAAASACGRNPLPLFIPCHRVVARNGGLGGFSAGLPWKEHLLGVEANLLR